MKLSFLNKLELRDTGLTRVWQPPKSDPITDEVSWGEWVIVKRVGRKLEVVTLVESIDA